MAACVLAWLVAGATAVGTDFEPWSHRMKISFSPRRGAQLSNFPALVILGTNLAEFAYNQFGSPAGDDLRFSNSDTGNEFPYEIESWNTNGDSFVWVRVPLMTNGAAIWAFWGNSEALQPSYTTDGSTWDSNYLGIWHLDTDLYDASGGDNDGTGVNNVDGVGRIAHAEDFNGSDAYISLEDMPLPAVPPLGAAQFTLSAWFMRRGNGDGVTTGTGGFFGVEPILAKGRAEADANTRDMNYFLGIRPTDRVLVADLEEGAGASSPGLNHPITGSTPAVDGVWNHAAVTYDGTWKIYLNGVADGELYVGEPARSDSIQPAAIAATLNSFGTRDGALNGLIDEARISRVARSADWIRACWLNVASNRVFCSYGRVETIVPGEPRVRADPATGVTLHSAWLNGYLVSTGSSPTAVTIFWGQSDGGTNAQSWSDFRNLGQVNEGPLSTQVTDLTAGETYYYRCRASNDTAAVWSAETQSFVPANRVHLVVSGDPAAYGASSPFGYGTHQVVAPQALSLTVSGSPVTDDNTRYAIDGWRGLGSVPATGAGNTVDFTILTNSVLAWVWTPTHQYLTVTATSGGAVDTSSGWRIHDSVVSINGFPDTGFVFAGWTGDVPPAHTNNPIELLMDRPREVIAQFEVDGTPVSGTLSADQTWGPSASPFVVTDDLIVPLGITLTVQPGVEVQIMPSRRIRVYGTLAAQGTDTDAIRFDKHPAESSGGYLSFEGGGIAVMAATGVFEYCCFSALEGPTAALDADDAWLTFGACTFSNMSAKVMRPSDCRVTIVGNRIRDTGEGINLFRCAGVVASNIIRNVRGDADALDVDNSWAGSGSGQLVLEWNSLESAEHSNADGIDVASASPVIRHNRIVSFLDKGISLGPSAHAFIHNNLIVDCNVGIAVKDSSEPVIVNNTIYGCSSYGVHSYEKVTSSGGGGSVTNCIIWNCGDSIYLEDESTLSVGHSTIQGSGVWPGPGNRNEDPLFRNASQHDFRLQAGSTCIGTGANFPWLSGTVDLKGDPRVLDGTVDIGVYEYIVDMPPRMLGIRHDAMPGPPSTVLFWHSVSNRTYSIEFSTNILRGWRVLTNRLRSTPPSNVYTDEAALPPQGFYRILLEDNL